MRAWIRRLHAWVGLAIASFLFVSGLTGSLIAFEDELDVWLNPELFLTHNAQAALPLDVLIARIEEREPRVRVVQVMLDSPQGRASEVYVEPKAQPGTVQPGVGFDRMFVDPATARVLGTRQWGAWQWDRRHLMPWINRFHRTLTLPGRLGNRLLGAAAAVWLLMSAMGLYLTLPVQARGPSSLSSTLPPARPVLMYWRRWKPSWGIKRGTGGVRLLGDLHRAAGLWLLACALGTAFTGVYLNLGSEVFNPVVRVFGRITSHPLSIPPRSLAARAPSSRLTPEQSVQRARALLPAEARDYEPWYFGHVASHGMYRVAFKERGLRERAFRIRYEQIFIDDRSGQLLGRFGYVSGTAADRFLVWMYPIHSGKALGVAGRSAIGLSGLALCALCVTGVLRWMMKRRRRS